MTKYNRNWDLDSLYPHPESAEFATIFGSLADDLKALADRSRSLPPVCAEDACVAHWRTFLMHYQDTDSRMGELNSFIGCHAAAHANSKLFQQFEARLAQLAPLREQIATNLELALQSAGDDDFNAFCTGHPDLARIQFFLEQSRRKASLRLPGEQELLAAQLGVDGIHGWGRLYDRVSADLRIEVMERGEIVRRSPGQVQFDSPQRAVRENNFFAADRAWRSIADTCADALNHIAGTRRSIAESESTIIWSFRSVSTACSAKRWKRCGQRSRTASPYS